MLLAVGVQVYSSLSLSRVLSENWRGAYDLLVTADAGDLTTCTTGNDELVAPNFVGFGSGKGISLDQWNAVRGVGDVEVAAPIGAVGQLSSYAQSAFIYAPVEAALGPRGFSVTGTLAIDDGVQPSIIGSNHYFIQVDPTQSSLEKRAMATAMGWSGGNDDITVAIASLPAIPITIVAVDPESERQLL